MMWAGVGSEKEVPFCSADDLACGESGFEIAGCGVCEEDSLVPSDVVLSVVGAFREHEGESWGASKGTFFDGDEAGEVV